MKKVILVVSIFSFFISGAVVYAESSYIKAQEYHEDGMFEEAIKELTKVIEEDVKNVSAYQLRGDCYFQLGDYNAALKDYNKAIKLETDDHSVYSKRSLIYYKKGDLNKSLEDAKKAQELGQMIDSVLKDAFGDSLGSGDSSVSD